MITKRYDPSEVGIYRVAKFVGHYPRLEIRDANDETQGMHYLNLDQVGFEFSFEDHREGDEPQYMVAVDVELEWVSHPPKKSPERV